MRGLVNNVRAKVIANYEQIRMPNLTLPWDSMWFYIKKPSPNIRNGFLIFLCWMVVLCLESNFYLWQYLINH